MRCGRLQVCLVTFTLLASVCGKADAQAVDSSSLNATRQVLSLNFRNNGQRLSATAGQQIEITLGTVGPKQYGEPQVSSPAIRLESIALDWPPNPGGPTFIYIFEAAAEGEAQVKVPILNSDNPDLTKQLTFAVTIRVGPAAGDQRGLRACMTPDQANTEPWKNAWTNLNNQVRQSVMPALPRLTGTGIVSSLTDWFFAGDWIHRRYTYPEIWRQGAEGSRLEDRSPAFPNWVLPRTKQCAVTHSKINCLRQNRIS